MRKIALALVVAIALLPVLAFAQGERRTPRCRLLYGNYEYENRNWDILETQLIIAGGCPTTTTTTTTTTSAVSTTTSTTLQEVDLGSAADFALLAGSTITCTGASDVDCDMGLSPGTSVTGFPVPCTQSAGQTHINDTEANTAKTDLTAAYNDAAGRPPGTVVSGDLATQTLAPGVYTAATSLSNTGVLTLSGPLGSRWIFQIGSTWTMGPGATIVMAGGAISDDVIWQVGSSATIDTTAVMEGNILADQSITLNTGAVLNGRALARIAAVTLDTNTVNAPVSCVP